MFGLLSNISTSLNPKWLSLTCFIVQNSLLIMILKLLTINSYIGDIHHHIISTTVVSTEILKFILSSLMCYVFDSKYSYVRFRQIIFDAFTEDGADCLKLCVPAILYTIQNNLQYIIEEAPLFLVLYHSKIITTAIFYSTMLARRLSTKEWLSIVLLAIGVSMVESSQVEIVPHHASDVIGILSVITACLTSGIAGVYFEKILKSSRSSIWVINMQMSLLSAFFSTSVALTQDSVEIAHEGIFTGYNRIVVLSIFLQALFGLAVALVVKYADNIYKGFGHSLSVIFCNTLSGFIFDDTLINETFLLGCFLVLASSAAYGHIQFNQSNANNNLTTFNYYNTINNNTTNKYHNNHNNNSIVISKQVNKIRIRAHSELNDHDIMTIGIINDPISIITNSIITNSINNHSINNHNHLDHTNIQLHIVEDYSCPSTPITDNMSVI